MGRNPFLNKVGMLRIISLVMLPLLIWTITPLPLYRHIYSSIRNGLLESTGEQSKSELRYNFKNETRHFGYLKVHKTGSATIQNIFIRFSLNRHLTVVLPYEGNHINQQPNPKSWKLLPVPKEKTFDVLFNHVIFSAVGFKTYLPNDSIYIASVREPFDQMISAFYYIRTVFPQRYVNRINGSNPHHVYLLNPQQYELNMLSSWTHNGMTRDFGYPPAYSDDLELFNKYLYRLGNFFHLVIVLEKFDESMVLLRRMLNWSFKDMLYVQTNNRRPPNITTTNQDKELHRKWSQLDYILYDFFLKKIQNQIAKQSEDYWKELEYYKYVIKRVKLFCTNGENLNVTNFESTRFSPMLTITKDDCKDMLLKESDMMKYLVNNRQHMLAEFGENPHYLQQLKHSIQWSPSYQIDV